MQVLIRILSLLILLLTCTMAALLMAFVLDQNGVQISWENDEAKNTVSITERVPLLRRAKESGLLSRLGLQPDRVYEPKLVAVMIENHEDARPHQKGLTEALMIQEWYVEGLISRFLVLFDANKLPARIGPVRSVRSYFLNSILPWPTLVIHAGGSPDALDILKQSKILTGINGISGAYNDDFERDESIAAPHNLYVPRSVIQSVSGSTVAGVPWPPYLVDQNISGTGAVNVSINYLNPLHNVKYAYDEKRDAYIRTNGNDVAPVAPRNVLVLQIPIAEIGELGRLNIDMSGTGSALLFRNGRVVEALWNKSGSGSVFSFSTSDGSPLGFERGLTWLTVIERLSRVSWKGPEAS